MDTPQQQSPLQQPVEAAVQPLSYARRGTTRDDRRDRLIGFGTVGIIVALMRGAFDLFMIFVFVVITAQFGERAPTEMIIFTAMSLLLSIALLVGSIGSFFRATWARRLLILGAKFDLILIGIVVLSWLAQVMFLSNAGAGRFAQGLGGLWCVLALRAIQAGGWWMGYAGAQADRYFDGEAQDRERQSLHAIRQRITAVPASVFTGARFRVSGIEATSGKKLDYISNARTEELARKAAITMGIEPSTLNVRQMEESE